MNLARRLPASTLAFALALGVYAFAAGPTLLRQSIAPHYVYLADALLHARLDLTQPPSSYDLLVAGGKAYVAGSPLPAILLMPFVALFGVGVSDILFGVVIGALNVALVQSIFKRWWLTLLFGFGTPHLYLATLGSVWFNAHVVAVLFGLLAVRGVLTKPPPRPSPVAVRQGRVWEGVHWFRAGLWLACAGLARPTMLFGAVFFLLYIVLFQRGGLLTTKTLRHQESPSISWRLGVLVVDKRALLAFGVAVAMGIATHGLYNTARFGSPADFGYQYTAGAPNITATYARYGGFNPRFLPCNLFVSILNPPEVNGYVPPIVYDACGYLLEGVNLSDPSAPIAPNPLGMSLFLVTPAFVLLFAARSREPLTIAAWAGLLATMLPLWMYHNTGSLQFGYRYWMDAAPLWLILMDVPLRRLSRSKIPSRGGSHAAGFAGVGARSASKLDLLRLTTVARVLILVSIAINVWGFLWMYARFVGSARF
jgi:hypothetical protein